MSLLSIIFPKIGGSKVIGGAQAGQSEVGPGLKARTSNQWHLYRVVYLSSTPIGSILNPLAGKFSEDTRKKGKGAKTGASNDWRGFYLSQYDWL